MHEQNHSHIDFARPIFDDFGRMNLQAMINRDTPVVHAKKEHCDADGRVLEEHKDKVEEITSAEAHKRAGKDHQGNPTSASAASTTETAQLKNELEQLKAKMAAMEKDKKSA